MAPRRGAKKTKSTEKTESSTRTKSTKSSKPKANMPTLDYRKVRKIMKKHKTKKLDNETMEMVADELKFSLKDTSHERFLRGKMLASVRQWDKE